MRSEQRSTLWQSVAAIETLAQQEMALEKVSVQPEAPAAVRVDLGVIFVSLELLCSFASGVATTVRPANNGWSCMV